MSFHLARNPLNAGFSEIVQYMARLEKKMDVIQMENKNLINDQKTAISNNVDLSVQKALQDLMQELTQAGLGQHNRHHLSFSSPQLNHTMGGSLTTPHHSSITYSGEDIYVPPYGEADERWSAPLDEEYSRRLQDVERVQAIATAENAVYFAKIR